MEKWRYTSIFITWDEKKQAWRANGADIAMGFSAILDQYGLNGWELVNIQPHYWIGSTTSGEVSTYHAVFKQRVR